MSMWDLFFFSVFLNFIFIWLISRAPEVLPVMLANISRKFDYVVRLDDSDKLRILPARFNGNNIFTTLALKKGKLTETGTYESRPGRSFDVFGRRGILAYSGCTEANDPKVLAFIDFIKRELGIKTGSQLLKILTEYNELKTKAAKLEKEERQALAESIPEHKRKAFELLQDCQETGYILSSVELVRPSDLIDFMNIHNPEAFSTDKLNAVYIARQEASSPNKTLYFILMAALGLFLLLMLSGGGGDGGTAAQAAGTVASGAGVMAPLIMPT